MGSKQTMVTAPVVVWIWDWIFLAAPQKTRRALYGGLAATWILLGALVAYERWPTSIGFALEGWTPWTYLLTQTTVIAHYVRLAILGCPLALDYDGWPMARSAIAVLPYGLPLLAAFGLTVWGVVRRRAWAFPAAVWFGALAPSSSILPLATEIAAGRRMYVPLAAMAALAVVGGYALVRRTSAAGRAIAVAAFVGVAAVYGSMTYARNALFASEERLWKDTVEQRPSNSRARVNYAMSLIAAGELSSAEEHLREAVRLKETNAQAHLNLGAVLCRIEKFNECVQHLERALSLDPRDPEPLPISVKRMAHLASAPRRRHTFRARLTRGLRTSFS
jgi:tetratricopeptide (TPR) repeat protein